MPNGFPNGIGNLKDVKKAKNGAVKQNIKKLTGDKAAQMSKPRQTRFQKSDCLEFRNYENH